MAKADKPIKKSSSRTKPTMRELAKAKNSKTKTGRRRIIPASLRLKKSEKKRRQLVKLPDNRLGRILDKLLFSLPRYFKGAWAEIRQTTWPNRRETARLTLAVFIFSSVFAIFVAVLDFVLDKVFKHLITK